MMGDLMSYKNFIESKNKTHKKKGLIVNQSEMHNTLFKYQKDMVSFALKNSKTGIFTTTGTGKTFMQLEWARQIYQKTKKNVLVLCPLSVTNQTIAEGNKIDVVVNNIRKNGEQSGINIINYEQIHNIDASRYDAVVLDEASILKSFTGKTRNMIVDLFRNYSYKSCFSATPSPNDFMELGNYSEFLDIMKRPEMLASFFIHDSNNTQKWRLKGHAVNEFWKWFASFSAMMNNPNDLGYNETGYILPKLIRHEHKIKTNVCIDGNLFPVVAETLNERRGARRQTLKERCEKVAELVKSNDDIWICWCQYNNESEMLKKLMPDAVEIKGANTDEQKEKASKMFANGEIKCLITKPSIFGFGMNFQVCHNQTFFPDDSFESFFQAEKRTYRLGQKHDVNTHLIYSDLEGAVLENLYRKERQFDEMMVSMIDHVKKHVKDNIASETIMSDMKYNPNLKMILPKFI